MSKDKSEHNLECKYCGKPQYRHSVGKGATCRECQRDRSRKRARERIKRIKNQENENTI